MSKTAEGLVLLEKAVKEVADKQNIPIDHIRAQSTSKNITDALEELLALLKAGLEQKNSKAAAIDLARKAAQIEKERLEEERKRAAALKRAEEEAARIAKLQEEEEARRAEEAAKRAMEEARKAAEAAERERVAEERIRAEEEARRRAEEEARRRAQEAARRQAEEEARLRAEEEARAAERRRQQEEREREERELRAAQELADRARKEEKDRARRARLEDLLRQIKGNPDTKMLADAIKETLCVKNYHIPPYFSSLTDLIEHFKKEEYATNAGLLKEAVRLRLLDDPFKMYLIQRNKIEANFTGTPEVVCRPSANQTEIEIPGKKSIKNVFNEVIFEQTPTGKNSKENFDQFIKVSNGDSSPNKTFMTYGPSGTGKTTIIKQIIKRECENMNKKLEIRAMMVYVQHDRMTSQKADGRPLYDKKRGTDKKNTEDLGFFKFDFFDMMKVIDEGGINFGRPDYDRQEDEYKMTLKVDKNYETLPVVIDSDGTNHSVKMYSNVQRLGPADLESLTLNESKSKLPTYTDTNTEENNITVRTPDKSSLDNYFKQCGLDERKGDTLQDLKNQFNYFKYVKTGFLTDVKATCDGRKYYNIDKCKISVAANESIKEKLNFKTVNKGENGAGAKEVSLIVDKVFNAARYRRTANNDQSSRAILCFFINYDEFETTYIDLFGNEETIADNSMVVNGQFATEASGIIILLDMIKSALMALRHKKPQLLTAALKDRVSNNALKENSQHLGENLTAEGKNQIKAHIEAFFNLFKASPGEAVKPRDFQLLVTSMRMFGSRDPVRLETQRFNHNTMLKLVYELGEPQKCINKNKLEQILRTKFGATSHEQITRIIKEYELDKVIDEHSRILYPDPSTLKTPPGFNYEPIFNAERDKIITAAEYDEIANGGPASAASPRGSTDHSHAPHQHHRRTKKQPTAEEARKNEAIAQIKEEFNGLDHTTKLRLKNDETYRYDYIVHLSKNYNSDIVQEFLILHLIPSLEKIRGGGRTRRGRKRRKTVKKNGPPKRKTHYRKFQRPRRTR